MLHADEPGWANPKVLSIIVLIFLCGGVSGAAGMRAYLHAKITAADPHEIAIESAERYGLMKLKAQLTLTDQQQQAIMSELDDYSKYYQNIEEERHSVAEHGKQRILNVLTEEQRKRFNEIFAPRMRADNQ